MTSHLRRVRGPPGWAIDSPSLVQEDHHTVIDPIAKLHSSNGSLISVYVNRRPQATRAALVDLVKPLRNSHTDHDLDKSIKVDADRIIDLAAQVETDSAPAVAIFASHADGIFEYQPLTSPVDDAATVGPRPYTRPLRAQPRPLRVGVLVADSSRARTYVLTGGNLHEVDDELTADRGKDNYGGFAGYEEQRIRARAEEVSAHMWRDAGRRLLDLHTEQPLDMVVIGGHESSFDSIAEQLHPYLQQLSKGRVVVDLRTLTIAELAEMVRRQEDGERTRRAEVLLERLLDEAGRSGDAVVGLSEVLSACNAHAIEHMVVAGPFVKEGVLCDACGFLGRIESECPVCGADTFEVDDVVAAAMDAVVESGGKADIVGVAGPLDASGVGALLRFSLG